MQTIATLIFPVLMVLAALSDLLTLRIPNILVLVLIVGFALIALVLGLPLETVAMHLACASVVLFAGFALFALNWIGGGDAKFAAGAALWLGFSATGPFLVYAALIGGGLTMVLLLVRRLPLVPFGASVPWISRLHDRRTGVPYGIALAGGALLAYPLSPVFVLLGA